MVQDGGPFQLKGERKKGKKCIPSNHSGLEHQLRMLDIDVVRRMGEHLERAREVEDIVAIKGEHGDAIHFLIRCSGHCKRYNPAVLQTQH